jgi:hypothetical protein
VLSSRSSVFRRPHHHNLSNTHNQIISRRMNEEEEI